MNNVVLGVSHSTATSDVRDALALQKQKGDDFSRRILEFSWCSEIVVLSTCNRTEIYAVVSVEPVEVRARLLREWCDFTGNSLSEVQRFTYFHANSEAVRHLYRVVSSLDSLVVGEGQILGQVKEAFLRAQAKEFVHLYLNHLFQSALALGKSVRSETEINQGGVSIAYAAVELCKRVFPDLGGHTAAVLGTGEMGGLSAKHLKQAGVNRFEFASRTVENAAVLARKYQAPSFSLQQLEGVLENSDIVISATSSPDYVVTADMVEVALRRRNRRPVVFVDIAAPRDIDPRVNEIPGVYSFCLDDLEGLVRDNRRKRLRASHAVEAIIAKGVSEYASWYQIRKVVPVIKNLRTHLRGIAESELAKHRNRLNREQLEVIEEVLHGVAGKWLHHPVEEIKTLSEEGMEHEASAFLNRLFQLPVESAR